MRFGRFKDMEWGQSYASVTSAGKQCLGGIDVSAIGEAAHLGPYLALWLLRGKEQGVHILSPHHGGGLGRQVNMMAVSCFPNFLIVIETKTHLVGNFCSIIVGVIPGSWVYSLLPQPSQFYKHLSSVLNLFLLKLAWIDSVMCYSDRSTLTN